MIVELRQMSEWPWTKLEWKHFSNFYPCPITYDGLTYPTVEHAYVAAKMANSYDRYMVLAFDKPGDVKLFGKQVTLRHDWEQVKLPIMHLLLNLKFAQPYFKEKLLSTSGHLIEDTTKWNDKFWGAVFVPPFDWDGENNLGKLLMMIRGQLKTKIKHWEETPKNITAVETYNKGMPGVNGVYAVRVKEGALWEDKFLFFYDGEWSYPMSDQKYRGEVEYWVGPLQRKMDANITTVTTLSPNYKHSDYL